MIFYWSSFCFVEFLLAIGIGVGQAGQLLPLGQQLLNGTSHVDKRQKLLTIDRRKYILTIVEIIQISKPLSANLPRDLGRSAQISADLPRSRQICSDLGRSAEI